VTLGGNSLVETNETYSLPIGVDHTISVVASLYEGYKGLLIRMESANGDLDLTGALQPGLNTVVTDICEAPVVGISHYENSFKKESSGTIRLDEAGTVYLDITMVGINDSFASLYGYSRYSVSFVEEETDAPSASAYPTGLPSASPTGLFGEEGEIPSDVPSMAPSDTPSMVPSDRPSSVPSDIPSMAPSDTPSRIPSDRPSSVPSVGPSDRPSTVPSDTPSTLPSDQPSSMPSDQPSFIPSNVPSRSPSDTPSMVPSDRPSTVPSDQPSGAPSTVPSNSPIESARQFRYR